MKNTQTVTDINEWKISKRKQREMAFDETDILGGKAIILMALANIKANNWRQIQMMAIGCMIYSI